MSCSLRVIARCLLFALCSIQELAAVGNWTAPSENEIPLGDSSGVGNLLSPVYDPGSSQLVLIWQDRTISTNIYYATYDGTSWTAPDSGAGNLISLGNSAGVSNFFTPVYDEASNQLVLVWRDSSISKNLYYATYSGTSWTTPMSNQIQLGSSMGVSSNSPFLIYDPTSGQIVLIWQDSTSSTEIYYATYDGTGWTTPMGSNRIEVGDSTGVGNLLPPTYDAEFSQLVLIWQDSTTSTELFYTYYNGMGWPTIFAGNLIPLGGSGGVGFPVAPVYDPTSKQVVQVWQDSGFVYFYYAIHNEMGWGVAGGDNQLYEGSSGGIAGIPAAPVYDPASTQLVFAWHGNTGIQPLYYTYYNGTSWTGPANNAIPLGSSGAINYLTTFLPAIVNDPGLSQVVAVWQDEGDAGLYYAYYDGTSWSAPDSGAGNLIPLGNSVGITTPLAPVYDVAAGQLVQVWQDIVTNGLFYAYYNSPTPRAFRRPNNRR